MATMATNHVGVAMDQVATSLHRSSHSFFPTTFSLVTRRKVNLNIHHRNRNGYCAGRNRFAEILCCSYSA